MRFTKIKLFTLISSVDFLMIVLLQRMRTTTANVIENSDACQILSCGNLEIRYPFRLKDRQPIYCGYPGFELSCTNNNKVEVELPFSGKFLVKDIDYAFQKMEIQDQNNCIPRRLMNFNFSINFSFNTYQDGSYSYFNCSMDVADKREFSYGAISCLSSPSFTHKVFGLSSDESFAYDLPDNCVLLASSIKWPDSYLWAPKLDGPVMKWNEPNVDSLLLNWYKPECGSCETRGGKCRYNSSCETGGGKCRYNSSLAVGCFEIHPPYHNKGRDIAISVSLGVSALFILIILMKLRRKADHKEEKENQLKIEKFLENNALRPTRYSHADIKMITNRFETKLGQGGYGSVFEGKLPNGTQVAVKILDSSDGSNNGEEFINEVGTIGRIHHLNVVRLLGFCIEGSTRALIYEFMLNSSLDKFIFSAGIEKPLVYLGWRKLQEIAIGIARGMEYLHQGCDQRILHFDIKPQNILLDHNFTPKICDFGLAKLCTKDTFVTISMAEARGTMGYIAPEVFSRNFGVVSYKSDVYSFGMVLLEMVGGKKNTETKMETGSDEEYFPEWVYNRLNHGEDLGIEADADGLHIVKKLTIVALWCIQWNPVDRPSMNGVLHMLEGNTENLSMAPNPFASTSSSIVNRKSETALTVILED